MHQRPVPVGFCEIRAQRCCSDVARDSRFKLLLFFLCIAEIAVGHRKIRLRADGLFVGRYRVIKPAQLLEQVTQVAISRREIRS